MAQSIFEKEYIISPDYCDAAAAMSPLAAFTIFQAMAAEHAEQIGVGGMAMAKRGEFWLTVHTRIDFFSRARLMDTVTAATWPEQCANEAYRCFRSYSLKRGEKLIALGRTQWAILGSGGNLMHFGDSGFPKDFEYSPMQGITDAPERFADDFGDEDFAFEYTVRSTDIDFGQHMNNVCYARLALNCLSAKEIASGKIKSAEIHFSAPSLEGERLRTYKKADGDAVYICIKKPDGKTSALGKIVM